VPGDRLQELDVGSRGELPAHTVAGVERRLYCRCEDEVVRLAGDLAGFRDCLEESWSGVKEDALTAYGNAQDTFDDVGNECLSALKIYARQLRSIFVHNEAAYEIARSLNVELMTSAFKKPPRYARQFAAADLAARDACKPT
jgi:hypothetical protein